MELQHLIHQTKIRSYNSSFTTNELKLNWYNFLIIKINLRETIIIKSISNNIDLIYKILKSKYPYEFFIIKKLNNNQEIEYIFENIFDKSTINNDGWKKLNKNVIILKKNMDHNNLYSYYEYKLL